MGYTAIELSNYTKKYKNKKTGFEIGCYSRSQVKALYPQGGYKVVGQVGAGVKNHAKNTVDFNGKTEPITTYKQSPIHRTAGYISCGDDRLIAVKKNIIWLWLLILILIIGIAFGVRYIIANRDILFPVSGTEQSEDDTIFREVDDGIVLGNGDILTTVAKVQTAGASISCPGITSMKFVAGQTQQNFVLSNPEGNPCFFQFQIVLDDTGEMIYESDLVPPGYSLTQFNLTRALEPGTYAATVKYVTYSFDAEQSPLNGTNMKTTITVE